MSGYGRTDFTSQEYNNFLHIVINRLTPYIEVMDRIDHNILLSSIKITYKIFNQNKNWLRSRYTRLVRNVDDVNIDVMYQQLVYAIEESTMLNAKQKQKQLEEIKKHYDKAYNACKWLNDNYQEYSNDAQAVGAGLRHHKGSLIIRLKRR